MRLFLGIEIPQTVIPNIEKQLADLKDEYPYLNWVPSRNYHITLHFFGEVYDLERTKESIEKALFEMEPFQLFILKGGIFIHRNIALFLEFAREKKMEHIVKAMNEMFPETAAKTFVPHLTIARYKIPSKQQYLLLKKKMEQIEVDFNFPVPSVFLYESKQGGRSPTYTKVAEFKLGE